MPYTNTSASRCHQRVAPTTASDLHCMLPHYRLIIICCLLQRNYPDKLAGPKKAKGKAVDRYLTKSSGKSSGASSETEDNQKND